MIEIDGSVGEGGGQILRTSLALSMCTGQPFTLTKIRAGRAKPGLMRQHLTCVTAAAEVCGAEVQGAGWDYHSGRHRLWDVRGQERRPDKIPSCSTRVSREAQDRRYAK